MRRAEPQEGRAEARGVGTCQTPAPRRMEGSESVLRAALAPAPQAGSAGDKDWGRCTYYERPV